MLTMRAMWSKNAKILSTELVNNPLHISTTWHFQFVKIEAFLEYTIVELTPPTNIAISEKPLVANLGVFHISHKCQGLENST